MKYVAIGVAGLLAIGFGAWASTVTEPLTAPWHRAGKHSERYSVAIDRGGALSTAGAKTIMAGTGAEQDGAFGTIMQTIDSEHYVGQRVRFSAMVKVRAVEGKTGLWMRADSGGRPIAFDNMQDRSLRGTQDWQRQEVVLEIPTQAEAIAFGVLQSGSGQSWMDDIRFEIVDDSVATTGRSMDSPKADLPTEPVL